ncbi:O-acyltransferase like protein-like isoform X3 [Choristoneura fumiferana]|uniref:O-acyltransferase like protein-like isoform X3 n=1 Tax=Choristoneura fumiferana TaxID=7141 RepID=UPI003D15F098
MRRADFYDASFHATEGLLVGNLASLGNYHQCLAINQDFPGTNIQGKYCLIRAPLTPPTIRIPSMSGVSVSENVTWTEVALPEALVQKYAGQSLSLAVCIPKSCAVEAVLAPYTAHPVVGFNYTEQYCRLPHDKPFVAADYVAVVVFSVLGILTLISTAYELRHIFMLRRDPEQANEIYRTCSLYSNTRRLLTFDKPRALDCLDGIRSLSTLMIVVYHNFVVHFEVLKYVVNDLERIEWKYKAQGLWINSADLAVDSFFAMSGLLLVYTSFSKMTQSSLLRSLPWFYLNRFLRLFPLLAAAVLLQASLLRVADGPDNRFMVELVGYCRRYWWSALLFVQNFVNVLEICVPPSWYLSADMQLHVVSPLVLFWVLGSRRAAWAALAAALLASLAAAFAFCAIYPSPFSVEARGASIQKIANYTPFYYKNTLVRSPPFIIGMLFGYILHTRRGLETKLPQWVKIVCHSLALGAFMYVIGIVHPSLQADWDNQLADIVNNSFRRSCWSLALCWMIFACVHGYGGPVNWFLSLRLWKFPARISYAMYLSHFLVQLTITTADVAPVYFNMGTLFCSLASDLVYTIAVSAAACVLIEEPAISLQNMLLRGYFGPRKQTKDGNTPASVQEEKDIEGLVFK